MKKFIVAAVIAFFAFSFYSFLFSGSKKAAEQVTDKVQMTSVDKYCKDKKGECDL
jgi:hypothetical protein